MNKSENNIALFRAQPLQFFEPLLPSVSMRTEVNADGSGSATPRSRVQRIWSDGCHGQPGLATSAFPGPSRSIHQSESRWSQKAHPYWEGSSSTTALDGADKHEMALGTNTRVRKEDLTLCSPVFPDSNTCRRGQKT